VNVRGLIFGLVLLRPCLAKVCIVTWQMYFYLRRSHERYPVAYIVIILVISIYEREQVWVNWVTNGLALALSMKE